MLRSRVQQVEQAIAEGRLEQACSILREQEVLATERGQQAARALVGMLLERARIHLAGGQLTQAKADADQALMFGGNQPEVVQLREAIAHAIQGDAQRERHRAQLLADARQQIDRGRLKLGEKWLNDASFVESRAANLLRELDVKKSTLENAIQAASAAMDRDDLSAAAREITLARDADATDARVVELLAKISEKLLARMRASMDSGRLDLTEMHTQQLAGVCGETADVQQYRRAVDQCRSAWRFLETAEPGRASEILKRVAMVFPSLEWIGKAIEVAQEAEAALAELRSGPLALLTPCSTGFQPVPSAVSDRPRHGLKTRATGASAIPTRFLLRVDGAGSFVVFRQACVTIGPISSSQQPDLGLLAEPGLPIATIERREDDYFVRGSAVAVNDRPGNGKLLAPADRIALSPRCRMSFNLPSAASTTAVLDLVGCRYPRGDVRRAILMDRDIILGPSTASHVRVDGSDENVILHTRDGRLFCEAKNAVEVNGAPMDRMMGIPMEAQVTVGGISFVVGAA